MTDTQVQLIGSLRFFTPVEVDGRQFSVAVYYGENNEPAITAHDLLKALGCPVATLEKKTYEIIGKLDLNPNKDYIVKHSEDVILNKVEHIFGFEAACKVVQLFKNKAAIQFFDAVGKFRPAEQIESDLLKLFSYDLIIRAPVFGMDVLTAAFRRVGYNDGEIDTESLINMLKKDRVLTKSLSPVKGHEHLFVRYNDTLWVTTHGFSYLTRKYIGLSVHESMGIVATAMPSASRLINDSIFCTTRDVHIDKNTTENQEREVENEGNI